MNAPASTLRRRLAAVAGLFLAVYCATRAELPDGARLVPLPSALGVARSMLRDDVILRLGQPDEAVSKSIWVYWNFRAKGRLPDERLDALVVFFANDRVSWLRLTERNSTIALLQQLRVQHSAATEIVSRNETEPIQPKVSSR
jgi:hypothetical protein